MTTAVLTINKCPGAAVTARGVATDTGGPQHMNPTPPQDEDRQDVYAALIKLGDAIETPDGALWVVTLVAENDLCVTSAFTSSSGQICVYRYEPTTTTIPRALARKVADVRQVRRP